MTSMRKADIIKRKGLEYYIDYRKRRGATWKKWYTNLPKDKKQIIGRKTRLRKYKLTIEDYDWMLNAQDGTCAICREANKVYRNLAVDHCHASGAVRGLLCIICNRQLAWYEKHRDTIKEYLGD